VATLGTGTPGACDALEAVATCRKPLADSLDTFEAVDAVGGGVLRIVLLAELGEVTFDCPALQSCPRSGLTAPVR